MNKDIHIKVERAALTADENTVKLNLQNMVARFFRSHPGAPVPKVSVSIVEATAPKAPKKTAPKKNAAKK